MLDAKDAQDLLGVLMQANFPGSQVERVLELKMKLQGIIQAKPEEPKPA